MYVCVYVQVNVCRSLLDAGIINVPCSGLADHDEAACCSLDWPPCLERVLSTHWRAECGCTKTSTLCPTNRQARPVLCSWCSCHCGHWWGGARCPRGVCHGLLVGLCLCSRLWLGIFRARAQRGCNGHRQSSISAGALWHHCRIVAAHMQSRCARIHGRTT